MAVLHRFYCILLLCDNALRKLGNFYVSQHCVLTTAEYRTNIWSLKYICPLPSGLDCCPFLAYSSVVVDSLFIIATIAYVRFMLVHVLYM